MTRQDLRIVFMGTPDFAVATLQAILDEGYNVVGVVTQPDKAVGRHGSTLQPPPVKRLAMERGLPVLQPEKMKDPAFIEQLRHLEANLQVVVAFRMLPEVVWAMPSLGTFNVHASLLPQYRGAAPINWAVINGERETGVTTFFLDHEIDTGRIILQRPYPIAPTADAGTVYDALMHLGASICLDTLRAIVDTDGHPATQPQSTLATGSDQLKAAPKLFKDNCRIDWTQTAERVSNFIRGLSPQPGAWTPLTKDGAQPTTLKVYRATPTSQPSAHKPGTIVTDRRQILIATGDTLLQVDELQLAGKKRMDAASLLNGTRDFDQYHCE